MLCGCLSCTHITRENVPLMAWYSTIGGSHCNYYSMLHDMSCQHMFGAIEGLPAFGARTFLVLLVDYNSNGCKLRLDSCSAEM
jgi:hypothetical protein